MPAQQFVVQLANQPGSLATLLELMAARGLDLRSVCASAMNTYGAAVLIFNDADFAREILRAEKYVFIESEALVTSAPDEPGALAQITRSLADAGVNLHGLAVLGWHQGKAELAFSVDDPATARRVLASVRPGHSVV